MKNTSKNIKTYSKKYYTSHQKKAKTVFFIIICAASGGMEIFMDKNILEEQKEEIRKRFLLPLQQNGELQNRFYEEENRPRNDGEYQRDYTRILYSSSFRRLQGKMQLFAVQSDQFIRNRLTHSLEVAQIARSIALEIGYEQNEIYIVEACSLAHDIGNPPFGHAGERFLNELCRDFGGFEGNAQTFRILTTVEQKRYDFQGLNLTYRTLLGVLKYYNKYNASLGKKKFAKQKFIYERDYELVDSIIRQSGADLRTLDVQIVDLADEIAYAAHDLEDGLRMEIFTPDEILHEFCVLVQDENCRKRLEEIFAGSKEKAGFKNPKIDASQFTKLYRKEITSRIINTLIHDIGIIDTKEADKKGTKQEKEIGFMNYGELAAGLKETTYNCITNNNEVYAYESRGMEMLDWLYHFYLDKPEYLPPEYRAGNILNQYGAGYQAEWEDEGLKGKLQNRLIIDYIAGMMDEYVKTSYYKLKEML